MRLIKQAGIGCLAWLLKFACPWYLRRLLSQYVLQPMLLAAFVVSVIAFGLFLPFSQSSIHYVSLPRKTDQAETLHEFETTLPVTQALQFIPSSPDAEAIRQFETFFPVPKELQHHVAFWKLVFSHYSRHQLLLHDSWYPQIVYEVIDVKKSKGLSHTLLKYRRILYGLDRKAAMRRLDALTPDEARVYRLFSAISEPNKFGEATRRLRIQSGQRENFLKAIRLSGVYQEHFDEIFRQHGLPTDLTRIPFVESYFKHNAYSYAGAAGIWQFMPATARMYGLRINAKVDERYDPFKSAESAARLLKANYKIFESWPLAITAYNHGPAGLLTAMKRLDTSDLGEITRKYHNERFGFYSRNYYAQFLAAAQIMLNYEDYFGDVEPFTPLRYEAVTLAKSTYLNEIVSELQIPKDELLALNRDLKRTIIQSRAPLPKNFVLKLPPGKKAIFLAQREGEIGRQVAE